MVVRPEHVSTGDPERDDSLRRAMVDDPALRKRVVMCHTAGLAAVGWAPVVVAYSAHDAFGYEMAEALPVFGGEAFRFMVDWHRDMADGGCHPRMALVVLSPVPYGLASKYLGVLDSRFAKPPTETEAVVVMVDYGGLSVCRFDVDDVLTKATA